jgi:CRISPR-associated protein Csb1
MADSLNLVELKQAVGGTAAAFRCITEYQPAGGPGDKVFPPTYEGGKYATERRFDPARGAAVDCVLLDSVQSQANRMELALLDAWESGRIPLPVVSVSFEKGKLEKNIRVTSLDAPHRLADAILRDSYHGKTLFRESPAGRKLDTVDIHNATALFDLCPTALIFGMWDSTGPKGGLGAKFQRAIVSEIVGYDAVPGVKTSSRIDPLGIQKDKNGTTTIYKADSSIGYRLLEIGAKAAKTDQVVGKEGKPSERNHGNVTPDIDYRRDRNKNLVLDQGRPIPIGGFTISRAVQTTTLSLPALRRLHFPTKPGEVAKPEADATARTALAALGLCAGALAREAGCDLRSRCQLAATTPFAWELLDQPGEAPKKFPLPASSAIELLKGAVAEARKHGFAWSNDPLQLEPSAELLELVVRSQRLAASGKSDSED